MTQPWEIPPLPTHGDENADDTYKAVGRCLSEWESLEHELAHLYSVFVGQPGEIAALREYGKEQTPKFRRANLAEKAAAFFSRHPDPDLEGKFTAICDCAQKLADRRADIAHGIVRELQWVQQLRHEYEHIQNELFEYALVPADYVNKKLDNAHRPA
jgi:hypothetical protein